MGNDNLDLIKLRMRLVVPFRVRVFRYYHADKIGVAIFQDMVQKYGGANDQTVPYFVQDFIAMVKGRGNHPR